MAFTKRNTKSLITRNQAEPPFPHTQAYAYALWEGLCLVTFLYFCFPYPDQILPVCNNRHLDSGGPFRC